MSDSHNPPRFLILSVVAGLLLLLFVMFGRPTNKFPSEAPPEQNIVKSPDHPPEPPLPGDKLLENYGSTNSTAREDLRQLHRVLANALILVKQVDSREYATNEDLAEFLGGRNRNRTPFISGSSSVLGPDGRLLDRWGNPLIVHPAGARKLELRSPGPDGVGWNDDDVMVDSPQ